MYKAFLAVLFSAVLSAQTVPKKKYDSVVAANHLLAQKVLHEKLIIQNAKFYLNIVNKKPSQAKFLRGWMNRALNQN